MDEGIATIALTRPPANALSKGLLLELDGVFADIEQNNEVRVVILHGEGRFFAAGADIKEFLNVKDGSEFTKLAKEGQEIFSRIERFRKPVIAAIHGAALGGGLELAMACHIRIASENAKLGLPELQLGLVPGWGGTQRLSRFVGRAKAAEMILTSESISGIEAKNIGLVNAAYSEELLMKEAYAMAKKIAAKSAITTAMTLELLTYAIDDKQERGADKEAAFFGQAFETEDGKEGIRAFIEKRKPNFQHK